MDIVLGVSVAPEAVRMVLMEGRGAGGVTVDEDHIDVDPESAVHEAADQVVAAILGTLESAAENGHQLRCSGVTCTDNAEADAIRDALAANKIENVMQVSAFAAAAALAQAVGSATNATRTALLFVEPTTATLALVQSADGSVTRVHKEALPDGDGAVLAKLAAMISGVETMDDLPGSLFLVGSGVDVPQLKPALEASTSLRLSTAEEPETALARGAALAAANASLGAPATSLIPKRQVGPAESSVGDLAYSAVADDGELPLPQVAREYRSNRTFVLAMSAIATFVIGAVALVLGLALDIRPHAEERSSIGKNAVAPISQAPPPKAVPAPPPSAVPSPIPQAPPTVPQAPSSVPQEPAPAEQPAPVSTPPEQVPSEPPPVRPWERPWERRRLGRGLWP